jgi:hypothetical protein
MIIALEGAKKECWHNGWYEDCENYKFIGGREMLIDTLNNVLVDNFFPEKKENLNFFSMQKTATPHPDTIRESFLARDGSYYSFINFEKEFKQWLKYDLLAILNHNNGYSITSETLNRYIHKGTDFEKYYDNCGDSKKQYPIMKISDSKSKYSFLRTDSGYKLIDVETAL